MYKVLVSDNLSDAGLKILNDNPEIDLDVQTGLSNDQLKALLQEFDGIVIRSGTRLKAEILDGQKRLKAIVRAGVGVDNVDLPAATKQGIVVMNTPAGNTISTAEHTIAMMMALARNIAPADASMKAGKWDRKLYNGTQLAGKTIGVIGLGRVGIAVAERCIGLEMRVRGFDPFITAERAKEYGIELFRDMSELVSKCDFITVHTPLTEETKGVVGKDLIAKMPRGVRILNCARGGIVDEEALADAIQSGHVSGAALDVFVNEPPGELRVIKMPGVLCTPHLGASTDEAQELVAVEAAEIIANFLTRNEVRHAVNMAPVSASEMMGSKKYIDLAYRLGLMLSQRTEGEGIHSAEIHFKGDAATKSTKLMTSAFTCGLLSQALGDRINIVNSQMLAQERNITVKESSTTNSVDFSTMISVTVTTDKRTLSCSGTMFGNQYLRLVKYDEFSLDAYLDGHMLINRHVDMPGLIGALGTIFGRHQVNISHMAMGREKNEPGGDAVAIFNLDNAPNEAALAEVSKHERVKSVELIKLPPAGASLPWLGL
jgi:D-3-phosphoglycerate dehydrogenase